MEFLKRADLSLGARVLYALTRDQASMTQTLREALEEPYKVVQSRLGAYEAELLKAGF